MNNLLIPALRYGFVTRCSGDVSNETRRFETSYVVNVRGKKKKRDARTRLFVYMTDHLGNESCQGQFSLLSIGLTN